MRVCTDAGLGKLLDGLGTTTNFKQLLARFGLSELSERLESIQRLMKDAHQRKFDAVLVWKLDRLGRSLRHLLTLLGEFDELQHLRRFRDSVRATGCWFVSCSYSRIRKRLS